jgi:hypothetical protein
VSHYRAGLTGFVANLGTLNPGQEETGGWMASKKSKTTFAKMARDRELRERRELKREKKKAAKIAKALGVSPPPQQPFDPE